MDLEGDLINPTALKVYFEFFFLKFVLTQITSLVWGILICEKMLEPYVANLSSCRLEKWTRRDTEKLRNLVGWQV